MTQQNKYFRDASKLCNYLSITQRCILSGIIVSLATSILTVLLLYLLDDKHALPINSAQNIFILVLSIVATGTLLGLLLGKRQQQYKNDHQQLNDLIISSVASGIYGLDSSGRVTFANPSVEKILGFTPKELIGNNMHDMIHHSHPNGTPYPAQDCPIYQTIAHGKRIEVYDEVFWKKDGTPIHIKYQAAPIVKEGETIGTVVSFEDVSEQKNMILELQKNQTQLELAQQIANIGSWYFDVKSQEIKWSKEMFNIFSEDINQGEPSFERHYQTIYEKDRPLWTETVEKCLKDGEPYTMQFRTIHDDGKLVWVEARGVGIKNDLGEIIALHGTCQDITESKVLEDLKQFISEVRYYHIKNNQDSPVFYSFILDRLVELSTSQFGMIFMAPEAVNSATKQDSSIKVMAMSKSWPKENNLNPEQAQQHIISALDIAHDMAHQKANFFTKTFNDAYWQWPVQNKSDLNLKQLSPLKNMFCLAIKIQDETPILICLFNSNLNYKNQLTHSVDFLITALSDTIQLHLAHTQLEEQKRLSEHSARLAAIGELASGIGHEINNPLAISMGYVDMLERALKQQPDIDPNVQSSLTRIKKSHKRIKEIVDGLRTLSRTNQQSSHKINLFHTIDKIVRMVEGIYKKDLVDISFINELPPSYNAYIQGTKGQIQQVLLNMFNNAKDALEGIQNGKIKVSLKYQGPGQCYIHIKDNGIGMSEEEQSKIFDPFFTTKEIGKGTGIGLAISKSIIQSLGGSIDFYSQKNQGTEFIICLPASLEQNQEHHTNTLNEIEQIEDSPQLPVQPSPAHNNQHNKNKLTALVVDDEQDLLDIITFMLEDLGFNVEQARNGSLALGMVQKKNFDLILTDICMPQMDGIDFIVQLNNLQLSPPPFVITMTGGVNLSHVKKPDREKLCQLTSGSIVKPFSQEQLRDLLTDFIENREKTVA